MKGSTININLSFIMDRNLHAEQVLKSFPNSFYLREYKFLSPRQVFYICRRGTITRAQN